MLALQSSNVEPSLNFFRYPTYLISRAFFLSTVIHLNLEMCHHSLKTPKTLVNVLINLVAAFKKLIVSFNLSI